MYTQTECEETKFLLQQVQRKKETKRKWWKKDQTNKKKYRPKNTNQKTMRSIVISDKWCVRMIRKCIYFSMEEKGHCDLLKTDFFWTINFRYLILAFRSDFYSDLFFVWCACDVYSLVRVLSRTWNKFRTKAEKNKKKKSKQNRWEWKRRGKNAELPITNRGKDKVKKKNITQKKYIINMITKHTEQKTDSKNYENRFKQVQESQRFRCLATAAAAAAKKCVFLLFRQNWNSN